jgi:hypothetical protein
VELVFLVPTVIRAVLRLLEHWYPLLVEMVVE